MSLLDEFDLDAKLHPPVITGTIVPEEEDDTSGLCNTVQEDCDGGNWACSHRAGTALGARPVLYGLAERTTRSLLAAP